MSEKQQLSAVEHIKVKSHGLRGTLQQSLIDEITGAVREDDHALIKFHGMYEQDDRDLREERAIKKLDKLYSFMVRMRIPGGLITPEQWVATHHIAGQYSTGVIKITTRQTIQLHGILKGQIKPTLQSFSKAALDSIAACGDVNRNVACASHPHQSPIHAEIHAYADKISTLLLPKTRAFYEIWLDEEKVEEVSEIDPLYKDTYLPRKFKIGIAIPPNNEVDVLTNDLGLIAIVKDNELKGFNIAVGGGLSATHGNANTYPRLATVIGFTDTEEKTLKAVYEVLTIQRDFGNRSDRKLARLKYTLDKLGVENFKKELENRCGFELAAPKKAVFTARKDEYGWVKDYRGLWHYTLFIENGRVTDEDGYLLKTALLAVAEQGKANFRFTSNQNLILSDIKKEDKAAVEDILAEYKILEKQAAFSALRINSIACVALPTCPLALAESQRYLPSLITKIEPILAKYQLQDDDIVIRMTGCPNGCGRPYAAEIGLVGTAAGHYNLHIGGDREGTRLNTKYKEHLDEAAILKELDSLFAVYKTDKKKKETFGDFVMRKELV
ncbi:NADPH-dependent assimilatory sulfite reductase hemoprotein subunit [Parasediminibacterium sp. JCM 36343]|uniref:NADPH-dependent assimilatory sulfite reductase hemoprotein subunit n=1 Tax=Parasediminibacterium sp. JCM 36343 TaxID=3374279 RepID=UPI003977F108